MVDNTVLNPGAGGDTIGTDDIAGVKYQLVKLAYGLDGILTRVSPTDPLPVSGPLTDTQLRAVAVPVSGTVTANAGTGTFAVSAVSLPLPTGAATETTLAALNAKFSALGQNTMVNSAPVVLASNQSAIPVTQSGTWNIGSITTLPSLVAGAAIIGRVGIDQTTVGTTNAVSLAQVGANTVLTGNGVAGTGAQRVTIASDNTAFTVNATPPTLTKGTQGATGYTTQNLKDAGRTLFSAATVIAGVTAVTVEALVTMVPTRAGVAAATATSQAVTSGKTLRITGINVGFVSTAAAVLSMRFALRMNPAGAVVATSPILRIFAVPSGAALAQAGGSMDIEIPDGLEFSGTQQFGITQIGSVATGTIWISVTGFEY